jgi:hypothetical protein
LWLPTFPEDYYREVGIATGIVDLARQFRMLIVIPAAAARAR